RSDRAGDPGGQRSHRPRPPGSLFSDMRMTRAAAGALLCLAACGLAGAPASAADSAPTPPVGGPLLTGRGELVSPLVGAPAVPQNLTAGAWLVADADTGEVLGAKAPHARYLPA